MFKIRLCHVKLLKLIIFIYFCRFRGNRVETMGYGISHDDKKNFG